MRSSSFSSAASADRPARSPRRLASADALHARERVLQVRSGVALEAYHLVEVELIVAGAVLVQIGVLHCADAHGAGDLGQLRVVDVDGQLPLVAGLAKARERTLFGLVEQ